MKRSILAVFVSGAVFAGSINASHAVDFASDNSGSTQWAQGAQNNIDTLNLDVDDLKQANHLQDNAIQAQHDFNNTQQGEIMQNRSDISGLQGQVNGLNAQLTQSVVDESSARSSADATLGAQIQTNINAITAIQTQAAKGAFNGKDGVDGKDGATGAQGLQGVQGLAGANGADGKDGKNGVDGKDGVTTTINKVQVDTATQTKVAANSAAIASTSSQAASVAQELQAAKQTMQAMNNNTNQQFKSLRDEVDNNKKQANAGISGAMAMAGLPQVQTNQRVMFSAGGATYNGESALAVGGSVNFNSHVIAKVSFSDDTANNMGASVGVGIGF
ncbi:YadA-like family protein [Enterobacter cloacae complex sp. Mu1197]|uniref:YadA-like family protein n=1 Tax=Enterobacter cloacae complex sp. Mu1197 TaxID=3152302 RepID=A0AAU7FT99_9ENTR